MSFFKHKATQLDLAVAVMEFIRRARFSDIAPNILPPETPNEIVERFIRAELYLVIVSTINFYPDKSIALVGLIRLIYEELYNDHFQSYEDFRRFFDEDFQEFEKMLHFGEKTGNGMLYGVSKWVYDEPKGNIDLIGQMQIVPHLFALYDQINKTHKDNKRRFKIID